MNIVCWQIYPTFGLFILYTLFYVHSHDKSKFVVQTCRVQLKIWLRHTYTSSTYTQKNTLNLYFGLFVFALPSATPTFLHISRVRVCVCSSMSIKQLLFHYRCWFLWKHYRFRKTTLFKLFVHVRYATHTRWLYTSSVCGIFRVYVQFHVTWLRI